jgi:hypothetical protein
MHGSLCSSADVALHGCQGEKADLPCLEFSVDWSVSVRPSKLFHCTVTSGTSCPCCSSVRCFNRRCCGGSPQPNAIDSRHTVLPEQQARRALLRWQSVRRQGVSVGVTTD